MTRRIVSTTVEDMALDTGSPDDTPMALETAQLSSINRSSFFASPSQTYRTYPAVGISRMADGSASPQSTTAFSPQDTTAATEAGSSRRSVSRETSVSSSVSPVLGRKNIYHSSPYQPYQGYDYSRMSVAPAPYRGTIHQSIPENGVSDSYQKPRKNNKDRSSIASTSSLGDTSSIGRDFRCLDFFGNRNTVPVGGVSDSTHLDHSHMMTPNNMDSNLQKITGMKEDDNDSTTHWPVTYPPAMSLVNLPLLIYGIKNIGAKSRVETQIKMRISVVRPAVINTHNHQSGDVTIPGDLRSNTRHLFEKIGTYKAVKIKAGMGARKRARKSSGNNDPNSLGPYSPREVLFLYTEVWCTDHPERAFACAKCVNRERKRAQARAPAVRKTKQQSESDELDQSEKPLQVKQEEVDEEGLTQEDKERILLFNCGPIVELKDGECDLPARLTCYCRHHKEKTGFRIVFKLHDHTGRLVASGTTASIMITDDHKTPATKTASVASTKTDGGVSASSKALSSIKAKPKTKKIREASASTEEDSKSVVSKRSRTSKPYDRKVAASDIRSVSSALGRTSPRGTFTPLQLSMTPLSGRSQPGSPLPTSNHASYFVPKSMGEPGSGAISPSLVMSGGYHDAPNQWAKALESPAGITAALPAISQQLHQWAERHDQEDRRDLAQNTHAMQLDESPWRFPSQGKEDDDGLPHFGQPQMTGTNGLQFQLQHPAFGSMETHEAVLPGLQSALGLDPYVDGALIHPPALQRYPDPEPDYESMLNFSPQASPSTLPMDGLGPHSDSIQRSASVWSPLPSASPQAAPIAQPSPIPSISAASRPAIQRLVPAEGPTHGGVEVTVLGENFYPGMVCSFGAFPAVSVQSYGPTVLVCLLPPNPSPGPVQVQVIGENGLPLPLLPGQQPAMFTYHDTTDRRLMEMALTAVGLRVTGQVVGAVEIARRIIGGPQGHDPNLEQGGFSNGSGTQVQAGISVEEQHLADELASAIYSNTTKDVQAAVIKFLGAFLPTDYVSRSLYRRNRPDQTALNHVSPEGQTLLHLASLLGFADLVHLLLRANATVDIHDRNGYTAFIFAAMAGHTSVARMLLAAGAREASCTFSNQTAATLARRAGFTSEYAAISSRSRRMQAQVQAQAMSTGSRRSSMNSESSIDADNPSSATENDSVEEDLWAISPPRATTAADILAVRRSQSPLLLSKSKYDARIPSPDLDVGNLTPRPSAAQLPRGLSNSNVNRHTDEPPPYQAVDQANWFQRTLSHLPQSRAMPPTPHIKDFIPPALWDKLPSAQIFVPHMPQADGQWTAQTWLAMPMSAFMSAMSTSRAAGDLNQPVLEPEGAQTAHINHQESTAHQAREAEQEVKRKQAVRVAQGVATMVESPTSTTAVIAREHKLRKRRHNQTLAVAKHEQIIETARELPTPPKVDKMLFLFWLPVLAIAFIYTIVTSIPMTIGRAMLGPVFGTLTKLINP